MPSAFARASRSSRRRHKQQVTFADLLGGKRFDRKLTQHARLKAVADYTVVGQPVARVDLPAKATGSFEYVHNVRLPGMLHGRVVRPAAIGAKLVRVDEASVKRLGVRVVTRGNFVGVVARREENRDCRGARPEGRVGIAGPGRRRASTSIANCALIRPRRKKISTNGDTDAALSQAAKVIKASYLTPFQMHGSIGPSCGVGRCARRRRPPSGAARSTVLAWSRRWPRCSAFRPTRCAWHGPRPPAATATTAPTTPPSMPRCCRRRSASRCACNGCATTNTAGNRKARRWSWDLAAGVDRDGNIVAWDFINITSTHSTRPRQSTRQYPRRAC